MIIWVLKLFASFLALAIVIYLSKLVFDYYMVLCSYKACRGMQERKINCQIQQIRDILDDNVDEFPSKALRDKIESSDVMDLVGMLDCEEISSFSLLLHFLHKCIGEGIKLNAITDFNHIEAIEQARKCDSTRFSIPNRPQLYGVPVSLKLNYKQKGFDTSLAFVKYYDIIHQNDGDLVKVIRQAGMIPFVRSVTPAGIIGNENINYIYGTVKNFHKLERTAGGSSGGEAALISSGCSPLGFGSDAAGSARTPALFSGIFGMMVHSSRITTEGMMSAGDGEDIKGLSSYAGILGKSSRDIASCLKCMLDAEKELELSGGTKGKLYSEREFRIPKERPLRIGLVETIPNFDLTLGQQRALNIAKDRLEKNGHIIIDNFIPPKPFEELTNNFMTIAYNNTFLIAKSFQGERAGGEGFMVKIGTKIPSFVRDMGQALLFKLGRRTKRLAHSLEPFRRLKNHFDIFIDDHYHDVSELRKAMKVQKIDGLLIAGLMPAYKHNSSTNFSMFHSMHILANAVGFSAGVVPITRALKEEEEFGDQCSYADLISPKIADNLKGSAGLPLGVQIACPAGQEELCLGIMNELQGLYR